MRVGFFLLLGISFLGGNAFGFSSCPPGGSGTTPCSQFSDCSGEPTFKVCGSTDCSNCEYISDMGTCLNATLTGGTCEWDGSCCITTASGAAPELPPGAILYFALGLTLVVFAVARLRPTA